MVLQHTPYTYKHPYPCTDASSYLELHIEYTILLVNKQHDHCFVYVIIYEYTDIKPVHL